MYKVGDIVEVKEPLSFKPHYWNRQYKVIEVEGISNCGDEETWLVLEVLGEEIIRLSRFGAMTIKKLSVTPEGQRNLILVRRENELIKKSIRKLKI